MLFCDDTLPLRARVRSVLLEPVLGFRGPDGGGGRLRVGRRPEDESGLGEERKDRVSDAADGLRDMKLYGRTGELVPV